MRGHALGFVANEHTLKRIVGPHGQMHYVFCSRCGCYAAGKGVKLNDLCEPEESAQLWRLRSRLERGRHPEKGHVLGELVVVNLALQGQPSWAGEDDPFEKRRFDDLVAGFGELELEETRGVVNAMDELDELEQEEAA
jgi:hypothetical protein